MKPVLLLAAVPQELALINRSLESAHSNRHPAWPFKKGSLGGRNIITCVTGPGAANAAAATAAMIERHKPQLVVLTGCGGAFQGSGMQVGDLAVATDEIFADTGVLAPIGWLDMQQIGLPLASIKKNHFYNRIPLARQYAELAMQSAERFGLRLTRGCFATVSSCSGTAARGVELLRQWSVICENMEGAAVALACLRYDIPCCEIRGISNLVEDRDMTAWDIPGAAEAAQRFVLKFLESMGRPLRQPPVFSGVLDASAEGAL